MTLIKCPGCGHTVSSVASKCPKCGDQLSQFRYVQGEGGGLTECRRCAHKVLSGAKTCPNCGVARPGRRSPLAVLVLALVLAAPALAIGVLRNRAPQPPAADLGQSGAEPAVEARAEEPMAPSMAPPVQAAPAPSAPSRAVPVPTPSPADSSAAALPTQTKWTNDWTNVRERRELEAPVVRVLRPATSVQVNDRQTGWWALYMDGRMVGYVAGSLLSDRPSLVSPPDTAGGHD